MTVIWTGKGIGSFIIENNRNVIVDFKPYDDSNNKVIRYKNREINGYQKKMIVGSNNNNLNRQCIGSFITDYHIKPIIKKKYLHLL